MESRIGPSFKKIKSKCYSDHKQGFYVYAKPNLCDPKTVVKYIGRYLGRPVIATSRIDNYVGKDFTFSSRFFGMAHYTILIKFINLINSSLFFIIKFSLLSICCKAIKLLSFMNISTSQKISNFIAKFSNDSCFFSSVASA